MEARETPSEPLMELEGLAVEVELSSDARGERMEKERRLSLSGLTSGDGMLMFALSIVVIEWADSSRPAFRLGRSASLVAASKEWESGRPPMRNGLAPSLPKLTDDERDVILASGWPWAALSGSISIPLVEVLDKDAMCSLFHPGVCPHHQ
jgi:hypothetical protein